MIDTRKQSENGFGKGLNMDSSIFNQDNNTMTSCLNGTTVTYDGNEFMLLTDLGNGRVESAYLPAGYVPVGTKEYGGILYIASYNPLENKGQIGCFPSPERNIANNEVGENPIEINAEKTFGFNPTTGVSKIYQKSIIKDDLIIRPGDKFVLNMNCSDEFWSSLGTFISDFNGSGDQILRLKVAVLDSSGNLQDITNQLNTFDGYFIKHNNDSLGLANVLDLRESTQGFNVYKGKSSGKLYLIAELNSPDVFEIAIDGEKYVDTDGNEKVKVKFIPSYDNNTYVWGIKFHLVEDKKDSNELPTTIDNYKNKLGALEVSELLKDSVLNYEIKPVLTYGILDNLVRKGSIDLNLLGSGVVQMNEWRYYLDITNNTLFLNWGLSTYLRNLEKISDVIFNFFDISQDKTPDKIEILALKRRNFNGNFMEMIPIDKNSTKNCLLAKKLYVVEIVVKKDRLNIETQQISKTEEYFYKLLYTSTYFNLFYADELDFSNIQPELNIVTETEIEKSLNVLGDDKIEKSEYSYPVDSTVTSVTPFYYTEQQTTTDTYKFKTEYFLEEEETFPFSLKPITKNDISVEYSLLDSDVNCTLENLNVQYLGTDISNANNCEAKSLKGGVVNRNNKEDPHKIWYNYTLNTESEKPTLDFKVNTVSLYLANKKTETLYSGNVNLTPYLQEGTNSSKVFGYTINDFKKLPIYSFSTAFGRVLSGDICVYALINKYPETAYTVNDLPEIINGTFLDPYKSDSKDLSFLFGLNYLLGDLGIKKGLKQSLGATLPNIVFWIGKNDKDGHHDCGSEFSIESLNENWWWNYAIPIWMGTDDKYYVLNTSYEKAVDGKAEHITGNYALYKIFSNVYVALKYQFSLELNISNDYAFTQNFEINYDLNLNLNFKIIEGQYLLNTSKSLINARINNLSLNGKDAKLSIINSNNLKFKFTIQKSVSNKLENSINSISIDSKITPFLNIQNNNLNISLNANGKIYTSDYKNQAFSNKKMYYIGTDDKVYPVDVDSKFKGSVLNNNGLANLKTLSDNFTVKPNPEIDYNQIKVVPSNIITHFTHPASIHGKSNHKFWFNHNHDRRVVDVSFDNLDIHKFVK